MSLLIDKVAESGADISLSRALEYSAWGKVLEEEAKALNSDRKVTLAEFENIVKECTYEFVNRLGITITDEPGLIDPFAAAINGHQYTPAELARQKLADKLSAIGLPGSSVAKRAEELDFSAFNDIGFMQNEIAIAAVSTMEREEDKTSQQLIDALAQGYLWDGTSLSAIGKTNEAMAKGIVKISSAPLVKAGEDFTAIALVKPSMALSTTRSYQAIFAQFGSGTGNERPRLAFGINSKKQLELFIQEDGGSNPAKKFEDLSYIPKWTFNANNNVPEWVMLSLERRGDTYKGFAYGSEFSDGATITAPQTISTAVNSTFLGINAQGADAFTGEVGCCLYVPGSFDSYHLKQFVKKLYGMNQIFVAQA